MSLVSIIIINYNTRDLLRECLVSVQAASCDKEIIVVDNASSDGSVEMVEREFAEVRLLKNSTNERFAKPNNDAFRLARGRYLFLLNSDAALTPGALESLLEYMDAHPVVGMCGPQLLNPDGSIQPSCRGFVSIWSHFCDMTALDKFFPRSKLFAGSEMTYFDHTMEREVDHVMAAAVIVREEALDTVGGFDERLSIYYNDLDWSRRTRRAGWKIVFFPKSRVVHHLGKTARPLVRRREIFLEQYENIFYYYQKHFGRAALLLYRCMLFVGFLPRTLYWLIRLTSDSSEQTRDRYEFAKASLGVALTLSLWRTQ